MKQYATKKPVHAAKILDMQGPRSVSDAYEITLEDMGPVMVSYRGLIEPFRAAVGGYYVEYADGLVGYLPGETFEALYSEVVEEPVTVVPYVGEPEKQADAALAGPATPPSTEPEKQGSDAGAEPEKQ